ncbi:MAG: PAS domain-containing protein [Planctomycetota bacterium]
MKHLSWADEFNGAVTVCDKQGIILYMNAKAAKIFKREGGLKLIGRNVLDCHPGPARAKLVRMLKNKTSNAYTIEKNGVKKLIYQSPWYKKGSYKGFVELSIEIPFDMPHFVRGGGA